MTLQTYTKTLPPHLPMQFTDLDLACRVPVHALWQGLWVDEVMHFP